MPNSEEKNLTFPRIVPLTNADFVGKELLRRKSESFGKNAVPRAVWVRAISNAVPLNDERFVGSLNVMVGGLLSEKFNTRGSFETLYRRPGRQIQDKPIPGIESVSISSKGEMQSLRKVSIKWLCPSLEDLNELSPYWLTPGISIWVEWGWGQTGKIPVAVSVNDAIKLKQYYEDGGKIYEDIIRPSDGNQDAYIGVITNFSFNQNEDGRWSCITELISMGQTLLSLDLNKDKVTQNASISETINAEKTQTIKGFIEETFSEGELLTLSIPPDHPLKAKFQTWKESQDVFNASKIALGIDWLSADVIYVSWRFIEQQIINESIAFSFDGQGGKGKAFQMSSEGVEISNDRVLYTTDADIGLVVHTADKEAFSFNAMGSDESGYMTNLYFNSTFVKDTFLGAETLEEALMKLLRGMSNACADIWNFKLQSNPLKENTLQVIDLNYVSRKDLDNVKRSFNASSDDRILSFGGYSGESILASVSFVSKINDQLALKYFVGRNKSNENKSLVVNDDNDAGVKPMFGKFIDRVLKNLKPPPSPPESEEDKKKRLEKENEEKDKRKNFSVSFLELRNALRTGGKIKNSESGWPSNIIVLEGEGKELLVEYVNRNLRVNDRGELTENKIRHKPLYPLEVSVTIDGVSGILPGNCFRLDNVPEIYKNSGVFQVVEAQHEISKDSWSTILRSFFRYTLEQTKEIDYVNPSRGEKEDLGEGGGGGGKGGSEGGGG